MTTFFNLIHLVKCKSLVNVSFYLEYCWVCRRWTNPFVFTYALQSIDPLLNIPGLSIPKNTKSFNLLSSTLFLAIHPFSSFIQMRQSCSMKYALIYLTVSINYFQVNISKQATFWENTQHLSVQSVKLKDARIVFRQVMSKTNLFVIGYRSGTKTHDFELVIL